ncbi:MAG: hypothetical protein BGO78_14705 [Chloroflexi bacterium 44-23]|nr:MAG: hypothetical protein BGO78_14705 [Chloroflexi bacterium 44-23]
MIEMERPKDKKFEDWLAMEDFRSYLLDTSTKEIPVYQLDGKAGGLLFLSSLLLPQELFSEALIDDLINWQEDPVESSWGYGSEFENGRESKVIYSPFSNMRPEVLIDAVPILTRRINCLNRNRTEYFEVNPEIAHIHDLHWNEAHHAFCTLNENGDIWDVVKVHQEGRCTKVSIVEEVLVKHMILGNYVFLRFFDLDRWEGELDMPNSSDYVSTVYWHDHNIHARWTPIHKKDGTLGRVFLRGFQIIYPPNDPDIQRECIEGAPRQYCTYIAFDWKHGQIGEYSCSPEKLGNYFVESDYPFETTPAFFKREVLRKYQNDIEKYSVKDHQIDCRSIWGLPFDINDEGQVHAYLIDLSRIPYTEQLHWKSFNESPKAGISRRAYKTDFLAQWDTEPEPLRDLKQLLNEFPAVSTPSGRIDLWQQPTGADANLIDQVHYPTGDSRQEWETEIIELDKLIIEGLCTKYLRKVANSLGIQNEQLGSILLLREILKIKGIAPDLSSSIIDPLYHLHDLRSKFAGHRAGSDAEQLTREIRNQYGNFSEHFRRLIVSLYEGLSILADLTEKGYINLS